MKDENKNDLFHEHHINENIYALVILFASSTFIKK